MINGKVYLKTSGAGIHGKVNFDKTNHLFKINLGGHNTYVPATNIVKIVENKKR